MESQFTPVTLNDPAKYYAYWDATPCRSLDYTLANLWGWQEYYGLEWLFEKDLCWIRQTHPQIVYWAPLGDWQNADWLGGFTRIFANMPERFIRIPWQLLTLWQKTMPGQVTEEEDRGQWEYLYLQQNLANLPGNKFHKKRNHLNSYVKEYGEPDYREVDDKMIELVLGVQDDWCQWHECDDSPSLRAENDAINRVLIHWNQFRNMVGGSLYVDKKMIAFSIGEKLDAENLGVHFEKCLNGYKGVYQAMNCEFVRHAGAGFKWINRAQDLDEEGLRQAKMTYMPDDFLKKYKVTIKL